MALSESQKRRQRRKRTKQVLGQARASEDRIYNETPERLMMQPHGTTYRKPYKGPLPAAVLSGLAKAREEH